MLDNPLTFQEWAAGGNSYPSLGTLYNWTRPGEIRNTMLRAGVIVRVNNRWLFSPAKWRDYCSSQAA